jgi:hypothetical protein
VSVASRWWTASANTLKVMVVILNRMDPSGAAIQESYHRYNKAARRRLC